MPLRTAKKLDRYREPARMALEAWLVEAVLDRVRQEVYYREALALGLDKGDVIIKRRLQLGEVGAGRRKFLLSQCRESQINGAAIQFVPCPNVPCRRIQISFTATRSICAISLCWIEVVWPSSQSIVTPLHDAPTTVPRSIALAFQRRRSPTLRVLDSVPVIDARHKFGH